MSSNQFYFDHFNLFFTKFNQIFNKIRPISKRVPTDFILTIFNLFSTKFNQIFNKIRPIDQKETQPILTVPHQSSSQLLASITTNFNQFSLNSRPIGWPFHSDPQLNQLITNQLINAPSLINSTTEKSIQSQSIKPIQSIDGIPFFWPVGNNQERNKTDLLNQGL